MLPWMRFHTRDWLDNKELRRCSPTARAVLTDLMCLAHEGVPYGHLSDKIGALSDEYMASRCVIPIRTFQKALKELIDTRRVAVAEFLFIPRMVEDEAMRLIMAEGGRKGGNPALVKRKHNGEVNLSDKVVDKHARTHADSGSDSSYSLKGIPKGKQIEVPPSPGFSRWWDLWSSFRGTNHRPQAENAYFRLVTVENESECFACTRSYLESLENPGKGYNPENFLEEQTRDKFSARWPRRKRMNGKAEEIHSDGPEGTDGYEVFK